MKSNKSWNVISEDAATWARWIAFYEAVNLIIDSAEDKNIALDDVVFKPLKIREYIESTEDLILRKLLKQEYNIDISYKDEENIKKEEYQFV
jgi:hypothetical protein